MASGVIGWYLEDELHADGESSHIHGELSIGHPAVKKVDDDAFIVNDRRAQANFGHKSNWPHRHFLGVPHL